MDDAEKYRTIVIATKLIWQYLKQISNLIRMWLKRVLYYTVEGTLPNMKERRKIQNKYNL